MKSGIKRAIQILSVMLIIALVIFITYSNVSRQDYLSSEIASARNMRGELAQAPAGFENGVSEHEPEVGEGMLLDESPPGGDVMLYDSPPDRSPASNGGAKNGHGGVKSRAPAPSAPASSPSLHPYPYPSEAANGGYQSNSLENYTVVLAADEHLRLPGLPGELRIWIGDKQYQPTFHERMTEDTATVPALGESATVEPFAPAFDIKPQKTQCIKIDKTGSEVRFELTPKRTGSFDVGANVYLYDSEDCSGAPVPKTAATLHVVVDVGTGEIVNEKAKELVDVLWDKFLEFWGMLVALIFGLFLFLIRGKLKQWFGFDGK